MEYTNDYRALSSGIGAAIGAVFGGLFVIYVIIALVVSAFSIITMWKIFEKANKPGWAVVVPFYNLYILFEITWGNGWYFLLMFLSIIPVVGSIAVLAVLVITYIKLAKVFGQSGGFAVGLIFLTLIFMGILAFGKDYKYVGINLTNQNEPIQQ